MSNEEAIKIILNYSAEGCGYCHQGSDEIPEAFTIATKALDKQIPKKVKYDEYGREEGYPHCPNCGKTLINDLVGATYCCDCGQKLDWNEGGKE